MDHTKEEEDTPVLPRPWEALSDGRRVGLQIKKLAYVLCTALAITSAILGITLLFYEESLVVKFLGIVVSVDGVLAAWGIFVVLNGFELLVENSERLCEIMEKNFSHE